MSASEADSIITTSNNDYKLLQKYLEETLRSKLDPSVPGLISVTVINMTTGSLLVASKFDINTAKNDNPAGTLMFGLSQLYYSVFDGHNFTVVNITVNGTEVDQQNLCPSFEAIHACAGGQRCDIGADDVPSCRAVPAGNKDLIIGLAVGIPLFLILAVLVIILLLLWRRKKQIRDRRSSMDDSSSSQEGYFSNAIAVRSSADAINRMDVGSNFGDRHNPSSRFPWEYYVRNQLPQGEEFKIERPKFSLNWGSQV